ncbi:MAG: single-stranded-DNA-specific exonuclease RecJ, partial [Acidobacteriaceae bacterium]
PFLTGVGVAFKLVQGLFSKEEKLKALGLAKGWEKWLLDLVSIGTVADCQELTSENRLLVHFGLKVMGKTRWSGLKALIETAGCSGRLDTYSIGFMIAPRINAAGRIKHADLAFKLLVTEDPAEAFKMANELNDLNRHRQMLTDQILSEARAQLELLTDRKILMAAGLNWPKGVVGLVAGRLAEEFNRPVLVLDKSEEFATGSGRSVSSFDLVSALNFSKDLLLKYGGHKQAAGFTLSVQNVDLFYKRLLEHADAVNLIQSDPELHIDSELSADEIGEENFDLIEKLGPFGFGNPRPKFVSYGLKLLDSLQVGSQRQHAKLRIEYGGKAFSAIAFNQPFLSANLSNKPFDAAFELSQNEWNGQRQIELKIIDTKIHG